MIIDLSVLCTYIYTGNTRLSNFRGESFVMKHTTETIPAKQLEDLLKTENEQLKKLHDIVSKAVDEEELLNTRLAAPPSEKLSAGQRISDQIARFGGSWSFIISFLLILVAWITYNTIAANKAFDPYPFILMNLVLSCIAALQAPIIMMSQNRTEEKDRQRAENDYMVNLKAEVEIRSLHAKIDLLIEEQLKTLYDFQVAQMEELKNIKEELNHLKAKKG